MISSPRTIAPRGFEGLFIAWAYVFGACALGFYVTALAFQTNSSPAEQFVRIALTIPVCAVAGSIMALPVSITMLFVREPALRGGSPTKGFVIGAGSIGALASLLVHLT